MILDFLFRRKQKLNYRLFLHGKVVEFDNALPVIMPALFEEKPHDGFAGLDPALENMEQSIADAIHLMRLSQNRMRSVFVYNGTHVLRIPAIYAMVQNLAGRKLDRFINNSHVLASMVQACACQGTSPLVGRLQERLMSVLVGIYARHYGLQYMKEDEFAALVQTRKFDMSSEKERKLRDDFLKGFRNAADRLSKTSVDRFYQAMGNPPATDDRLRAILHVMRYSSRLMGRTAVQMKHEDEHDVHELASYVAVLYSICSAQIATGKRLCVITAEEYGRSRTHHRHKGLEKSARYNMHALTDFMAACRLQVLDFFQGKDQVALYSEPEKIYLRPVEDSFGAQRWICFRSKKGKSSFAEREKAGCTLEHKAKIDPTDEDLVPVGAKA